MLSLFQQLHRFAFVLIVGPRQVTLLQLYLSVFNTSYHISIFKLQPFSGRTAIHTFCDAYLVPISVYIDYDTWYDGMKNGTFHPLSLVVL